MRHYFSLAFIFLFAITIAAGQQRIQQNVDDGVYTPQNISPDSAKYHINTFAAVCGKVKGVRAEKDGTVYLDLDRSYPFNAFTAVIKPEHTIKFKSAKSYLQKNVCVTGLIFFEKEKAHISLTSPLQVKEQ